MKRRDMLKAFVSSPFMATLSGQQVKEVKQKMTDKERERRIAWFREAKFGLFIHWGLYAIPAGIWKGKEIPGLGE